MTPFTDPITPDDVAELIDFTVPGNPETESMALMQRKGVAGLYNILCTGPVAYLADEVGMGKTYQALALAALAWNQRPEARILFISPRQNLQEKWVDDYGRFFASNYRRQHETGDDRVTSVLFGESLHRPVPFVNLRSWTPTIGMPERIVPFLRHTSFMRPVYIRSADLAGDMDQLWRDWQDRFKGWSLFDSRRPRELTADNASRELNLAFAGALNEKITGEAASGEPYFDLVVVDEAQCLRHPGNQTNSVLHEVLRGQVAKWLFMSATPAHGGPGDIPTIVNHYPDCTILDPELANDLPELQNALRHFMVRRQRRYITGDRQTEVGKSEYRDHDKERWAVKDADMSALSTLAMGLVQKGLVDVLASRNNRYRIGFLSSFESLQSSLRPNGSAAGDPITPDGERSHDFEHDPTEVRPDERDAPDAGFVDELAGDFQEQFDMPLPHAKVDSVVDQIAPLAFGSKNEVGGGKFLIFTRRVSTVHALRDRLARRHRLAVEGRMRRCWNIQHLDWDGGNTELDDPSDSEDAADSESHEDHTSTDSLRRATAKGGWLHRYRQTFRATGRNSLFFEDGWLERLCRAGGKNPMDAARAMPDDIWAESWTHASKAGGSGRQYRANRLRYLAVQGVGRMPEVFGLSKGGDAEPWRVAYEACLHNHLDRAKPDAEPHRAHDLFQWPTLWTSWDATFGGTPLALPAGDPDCIHGLAGRDKLCRRQAARTILGQTFRLTDTLLDLYFADEAVGRSSERLAERFLDWLRSDDLGAVQVRNDCEQWLEHLCLIVDSCLDGAGRSWHELVHEQEESWVQLFEPGPVVGVTGGSGGHRRAVRQFRTPSLPRVIVCTDTLKEGVDLHLFCDHVLHYGVAWTSGDMEQRVGRVDRYFSQIERRLAGEGRPPDVKLHVGYPHIVASLERGQVERVIQRQKDVEALMDSPLAGTGDEEREQGVDAYARAPSSRLEKQPFGELRFPNRRRSIAAVSVDTARADREHYLAWYKVLSRRIKERGWQIGGDGSMAGDTALLARRATLILGEDRQHEIEWSFDAALRRYVITLASPPWPTDAVFSGGERRRIVGRELRCQSFVRLLVPAPDEGADEAVIMALVKVLEGNVPKPDTSANSFWGQAYAALSPDGVDWESNHKAKLMVRRGERAQRLAVYAYEGSVRAVSVVSATLNRLGPRNGWKQPPSANDVREWILDANNELPLGYLDLHERDGLVFGIHVLHGNLSADARRRLLEEVGWRADAWEASLTGADRQ